MSMPFRRRQLHFRSQLAVTLLAPARAPDSEKCARGQPGGVGGRHASAKAALTDMAGRRSTRRTSSLSGGGGSTGPRWQICGARSGPRTYGTGKSLGYHHALCETTTRWGYEKKKRAEPESSQCQDHTSHANAEEISVASLDSINTLCPPPQSLSWNSRAEAHTARAWNNCCRCVPTTG